MWKRKNTLSILLALALLSSIGMACSGPNYGQDLLKTDTITMQKSVGGATQACYSVVIDYNIPSTGFQTALSVANLWGYKPAQGLDYSVRGKQKGNSNVLSLSLLLDAACQWTKITVSYLVTSRNDLFAGSFVSDAFSQYDCAVTGLQEYSFNNVVNGIPINYDYQIRVFISGIESKDAAFDFSFKRASYNTTTGLIDVRAQASSQPHIENIHISYIIYRSNIAFTISVISNIAIKDQDYAFQITNSFSASVPQILAITFDSDRLKCIGFGCNNVCTNNCINIPKCTSAGGIIRGKQCQICGQYQVRDRNNQCVPNCQANQIFNSRTGICECQSGYIRDIKGQCIYPCGTNQAYINGKCTCLNGYGRMNDNKCAPCPSNSLASNQKCICNKDYYWCDQRRVCDYVAPCPLNGKVQWDQSDRRWKCFCSTGYRWNQDRYACDYLPTCPANSQPQYNPKSGKLECKCDVNYYQNSYTNTCDYLVCPANSRILFDDNKRKWVCQCLQGFLFNIQRNTCDAFACQLNSKPSYDNKLGWSCICNQNYKYNQRTKLCDYLVCPANSKPVYDNGVWRCACNANYYWNQAKNCCDYLTCPSNSKAVFDSGVWRCACDGGYMWNDIRKTCDYLVCPANSRAVFDSGVWRCSCDAGYMWNDVRKTCDYLSCPSNSKPVFDSGIWRCACDGGYMWNDVRKCCDYLSCPSNSKPVFDNGIWRCACDSGYMWNDVRKTCDYLSCPVNSKAVFDNGVWRCVCNANYFWNQGKKCCDYLTCPPNSKAIFDNNSWKCSCNQNYKYNQKTGQCDYLSCPPNSNPIYDNGIWRCACIDNYNWNTDKKCCDLVSPCGPYATITYINGIWQCVCNSNCYGRDGRNCKPYPICSGGSVFDISTQSCKCPQGQQLYNGQCRNIIITPPVNTPTCPDRSSWNQTSLRCECQVSNQHMIDKKCQSCKQFQTWTGRQCQCNKGYYKINGICRTCDLNSFYKDGDCQCNIGYYGNGQDNCYKCHSTCSQCKGPNSDQCIKCSDVSFTLKIQGKDKQTGVCIRDAPCPIGLYSQQGDCKPCSAYCAECKSQNICKTCIQGFQIKSMQYGGQKYSYCLQICGDGKRYQLDCDDGNKINGDGCNCQCQIQQGWTCSGGSSIKPSTCVPYAPSRTYVNLTGTVHLFGKVVQGVRLNYIPKQLTKPNADSQCSECQKLLWVRVISSAVVPGVKVIYLPKSQYQFMVEFDFNGLFAIPLFTISIQINPDFAKYFTDADLAQIQVKTIDPSTLARKDKSQDQALSFNQIQEKPVKTEYTVQQLAALVQQSTQVVKKL